MRVGESPLFCWSSHICNMQEAVASKIEEIAQRVAESEGMEVVEVEVKGGGKHRFVRISIDKPEGVTHGDCELISQQVGTILDVEDVVPGGRYTLEVSSPGVERKLLKPQDYQRFQGKKAKITLRDAGGGPAQLGWHSGRIRRRRHRARNRGREDHSRFPLDQVEKANLKFEW